MKTIEFTVRMQVADDAEPEAAARSMIRNGNPGWSGGGEVVPGSVRVIGAHADPILAMAIDALSQRSSTSNTVELLQIARREDLPIEMLVTDQTPNMIELKPTSNRFGWVSHMLYPTEAEALVGAGIFFIKS